MREVGRRQWMNTLPLGPAHGSYRGFHMYVLRESVGKGQCVCTCVCMWGGYGVISLWHSSSKQLPAPSWLQAAIRRQEANDRKWRANHTGVPVTAVAMGDGEGLTVKPESAGAFFQDLEESDAACATSRDRNKPHVPLPLLTH